jgi:hypothetical protein
LAAFSIENDHVEERLDSMSIIRQLTFVVKKSYSLIKNLSEIDSLPQLSRHGELKLDPTTRQKLRVPSTSIDRLLRA